MISSFDFADASELLLQAEGAADGSSSYGRLRTRSTCRLFT